MAVREILQLGNPLLWKRCETVTRPLSDDIQELTQDLADTLAAVRERTGYGRGIAAPQVGSRLRLLYVDMPDGSFSGGLINPEVMWESPTRVDLWDDCFSFPDLLVKVSRAEEIGINYTDERGERQFRTAKGALSELLQHEVDHLDGILALQRAVSPQSVATRGEWERRYRHGTS